MFKQNTIRHLAKLRSASHSYARSYEFASQADHVASTQPQRACRLHQMIPGLH